MTVRRPGITTPPTPPEGSPSAARGCIKGIVLQSRLEYVKKHGGEAALEDVLTRLQPAHTEILRGLVLAASWYPFEVNEDIDRAITDVFGGGRLVLRRMGNESAAYSLTTSHHNLVRSLDPHELLKKSAQILRLYYDSGSRTYERLSDTSARLVTVNCKSFSEEDCQTNLGWHETALAKCGASNVRVTDPKCRARGDSCCEYLCVWK